MSIFSTVGGVAGGSLVATLQSFGAGGAAGTAVIMSGAATTGAIFASLGAIGITGAVLKSEYDDAQNHTLGDSDSDERLKLAKKNGEYVLLWENWVHGQFFRCFETFEEASEVSKGGRRLRRIIVKLTKPGEESITNEHNQTNEWKELKFSGKNFNVDNTLRRFLAEKIKTFNAVHSPLTI